MRTIWLVTWTDGADPDRVYRGFAETPLEAREICERFLGGESWTPDEAEEWGGPATVDAYSALVDQEFAGDILGGLAAMAGFIRLRCDSGCLEIEKISKGGL